MLRTRIVCTIGPASREPDTLRALVRAGMDVARLNFSHGDHAEHGENIARIRAVSRELDTPVAILADLQGPKLRMGKVVEQGVVLATGSEVWLVTDDIVGTDPRVLPVQYEGFPVLTSPGDRVLIDDGLVELRVAERTARAVRCEVIVGGMVTSNKGLNLPGASLDLPSITDKDRADLAYALAQGVDWVALSFVRTAGEIVALRELMRELVPGEEALPPVIAKIEKPAALDNVTEIVAASDGVMVARGDLGIELSPEQVPLAQKRIVRACNESGIPVVTATQMLDSMIRNPRPTRAEASDVANAVLDGTDAVMLSGETSVGAYPVAAVQTMARIVGEVEAHAGIEWVCPRSAEEQGMGSLSVAAAVSLAASQTAHAVGAAAIIAPTASGYTARLMAQRRPCMPIVAVTPSARVQRQLMLYRGVTPLLAPRTENTDGMIAHAVDAARARGLVADGDRVVVTAGAAGSAPGTTNLIRIQTVGA
ncbi:MAG: pyruvate kinase [Anaerolineae bacterium]|nr:pyruvate kinase [Anaerolineae bacterium]